MHLIFNLFIIGILKFLHDIGSKNNKIPKVENDEELEFLIFSDLNKDKHEEKQNSKEESW